MATLIRIAQKILSQRVSLSRDIATLIPRRAKLKPPGAIIDLHRVRRELHDGDTIPDGVSWTLGSGRRMYAGGLAETAGDGCAGS